MAEKAEGAPAAREVRVSSHPSALSVFSALSVLAVAGVGFEPTTSGL